MARGWKFFFSLIFFSLLVTFLGTAIRGELPKQLSVFGGCGVEAEPAAIPYHVQEDTSVHEAGHAVVDAYFKGPGYVQRIIVRTEMRKDRYYGYIDNAKIVGPRSRSDLLGRAAGYLAGRMADEALNRRRDDGAVSDLRAASDIVWKMHLEYGMGSSLLVRDKRNADAALITEVENDLIRAELCSRALVESNENLIRLLSSILVKRKPVNGERIITSAEFSAILKEHPVAGPLPPPYVAELGIDTFDDVCDF